MNEKNGTYDISYNLFNYAYKELAQDAVICWLIKWAYYNGPGYEKLIKCGQDFVKALFVKHGKNVPDNPGKVEIWQQDNSIDVLACIGDYVLLIEDKTGTRDHSKQLERYYELVRDGKTAATKKDREAPKEENIIPIYLKTETQSLRDKLRIESSTKYKVFERTDFLSVIEHYHDAHPIVSDFCNHLRHKAKDTKSYEKWREDGNENEEVNDWSSCEGFLHELENQLCVLNSDGLVGFDKNSEKRTQNANDKAHWGWGRVNNKAGGFFGFWWYFFTMYIKGVRSHNAHYGCG